MSEVLLSLILEPEVPIFCRGKTGIIRTGYEASGFPIDKPLWTRDIYIPSAKNRVSSRSRERSVLYLLRDGPGDEAKELGWANEESLIDWSPPESLIDLDPGYKEVKKGQEEDLIEQEEDLICL